MAEGRNYIALEWVIGEIEETLVQARNSLEDYVDDPDDLTKLKFCLTYAHQVNGSVKMLELHGAAILASEIELLCQALVDNAVADASAAEILMTAFIQLSAYLQRVQSTHDDQPASLLNILNELRGLRGQDALTRSEVFNPDVSKASAKEVSSGKANIEIEEFNDLIRKLRQSFQAAMVGVMRDQELDQNYDAIEKVGAHLHQISLHTASEPLWQIFHAVGQILKSDAQAASADTKLLLRNVDGEIKHLQEFGVNAFGSAPSKALLKSLLFTVAEAEAISELVGHIQTEYELKEALKESELSSQLAIPDTEAMRGVMKALNEELQSAQEILDQNARGEVHEGFELVNLVSILSKVVNTLFVLGANEIAELMQEQQDAVVHLIADDLNVQHDALLDVAAKIVLVQDALQSTSVEEAKKINLAGNQLLDAHISVLREARAGLAQAKEAVIEFVASQWNPEKLYGVPELLDQIQGGLAMIPLERAAAITRACKQYLTVDLLGNGQIPDWQVLDSLADAMTSVEYYLECLADDGRSDLESILLVAEQSVATLGYPIELDAASVAPEEETPVDTSKFVGKIDVPEAPAPKSDEHLDDIDEELMEVFIEEADEVLAVIAEFMPKWHEDTQDIAAMTELRRAFHTLKGSGRMVGEKYLSALAWAIESMFNRILDSNIPSTHDHVQLVAQAQALVPELMLAFKERRIPDVANDIVNISAEAEVLGRAESTANTAQSNAIETESEASEATSESIELSAPQAADTEAGQSVVEIPNLGVVDNIEDVDEDVIEIFIEEAEEVLEAIDERLPGLQANFDDAEALADLRRAFHTLKGSGRMVGANVIGETAWAVENMLNRIVEGTHKVNEQTLLIMSTARVVVPPMIEAFKTQSQAANLADAERLAAYADIIAKGETPNFAIVSSADAPVTEPVSEPELVAEEQSLEVDLDETTNIELEAESEDSPSSEIDAVDVAETIETIDDPYAELDPELISIFLEEARGHMEVYHDFVTEADQESAPILLSESLQRALHTLKGSAHMAGIEPLAERVSPIERLVKEFRACQTPVDSAVLDLMKQGEYLINEGISLLVQKVEILDDGVAEYAQHVISACEQNLANLAHAQSDADNREDIAATVLAAGMERLLHASDLLNAWIANKLSPAQLKEIAEDLSSLSSHAEQAEYKEIQNLAAVLGELYARVDAKALAQQDAFYEIAQRSHETLIDMMDMLAAGQNLIAADQLIAELSAMPVAEIEAVAEQTDSELVAEQDDFENLLLMLRASLADADEETLEIFNEEANELIDVVDDAAAAWAAEPENAAARDNLLRPLHTLKGGARLSGLKELGDYTHEFETLIESQLTPNAELFAQIKVYVEGTHRMIECVQAVDAQPNDSSVSNIQSLADIEDVEAEAEAEALAAVDPEVLEIFMEEANDQLEQIESSIITWKDDRKNTAVQDKLKRVLHTLKGGARLSGIVGVGDLSHEFESYIIERDAKLDFDDEFFAQLDTYQGQLHQEIDRIAKGEAVKVESTGVITSMADLPEFANKEISQAAVNATQNFISSFEQEQSQSRGPQEVVKVSAELLANLVNLAGETSISRSRLEEQISEQSFAIEEMDITLDRMAGQLRRLEIETEAQIVFRMEQVESEGMENFDPLEMDRYSQLQQLSRSLSESASDMNDTKETFGNTVRDMETLLLQQSRINTELQEGLMRSQMVPIARMVPRLRRIVRQVSSELDKKVDFHFDNVEGELDRTVLEKMIAPLEHMLRNAVDHGIENDVATRQQAGKPEAGSITLAVRQEGGEVVLSMKDDGGGINLKAVREKAIERGLMTDSMELSDHEIAQFILHAGFSTATEVTQISGRGVGMDVVSSEIKQLGGSVDIETVTGRGTEFIVRLPFTVSVNRALMVCIGNDTYAIPLNSIEGIVRVSPYELEAYYQPNAPLFEYAGQNYNLMYMGSLMAAGTKAKLEGQTQPLPVVLIRGAEQAVAVQVDRLLGSREIVVKSLGPQFSMVEGLSGATVLGDGSVVVIVDLPQMIRSTHALSLAQDANYIEHEEVEEERNLLVMVVDDSVTVRKVTSRLLERHGIDYLLAKDGVDAMQKLAEAEQMPDCMLLDIEMPRMDGFEVASRVRHTERMQDIPIVMITSRTGEKHRDRALSLGVNKYLGKPFQETSLLEAIEELTGREISL